MVEWVLELPFSYRNWARIKIHSLRHSLASPDTNLPDLLLGNSSSFQKQVENPQKANPEQLKPQQRSKMFWGVWADSSALHLVLAKQSDCACCASAAPSPPLPAGLTGALHLLLFSGVQDKVSPSFFFFSSFRFSMRCRSFFPSRKWYLYHYRYYQSTKHTVSYLRSFTSRLTQERSCTFQSPQLTAGLGLRETWPFKDGILKMQRKQRERQLKQT